MMTLQIKAYAIYFVVAGLFFAHAGAQGFNISDLPPCGLTCASIAASAVGCTIQEANCMCSNTLWVTSVIPCVSKSCSMEDQTSSFGIIDAVCAAVTPSTSSSGQTGTSTSSGIPIVSSKFPNTPSHGPGPISIITTTSVSASITVTTSVQTTTAPASSPTSPSSTSSSTATSTGVTFIPAPSQASNSPTSTTVILSTVVGLPSDSSPGASDLPDPLNNAGMKSGTSPFIIFVIVSFFFGIRG